MRFLRSLLLLVVLCAGGSNFLHAMIRPAPGEWGIQGEFLYWHPLYDQSFFANKINASNNVIGPRIDNPFDWQPAYRLEGIYAFCNTINDVHLRWTYLDTGEKKTVIGDANVPAYSTVTPPINAVRVGVQTIISNSHLKYYAVDGMLGQLIYDCFPFAMDLQGGIHYAHIDLKQDVLSITTAGPQPTNKRDRFWGVGPELALDMHYVFPACCSRWCGGPIALNGNLRGALLVSESKATLFATNPGGTSSYDVTNDKKWRVTPTWDLRFGLSCDWCFNCFAASFEIGYEVLTYTNAVQSTIFTDDSDYVFSFDSYDDLGFHGPYVAVGVSF